MRNALSLVTVYGLISPLLQPVARYFLNKRMARGKEDPARIAERQGTSVVPRPSGPLIWIHAISVGESISVLPLMAELTAQGYKVLITTGTTTSAQMLSQRLPSGAIHQYVPMDVPRWVERFLDHWRPDVAVWIDSEMWPNLIRLTEKRGIPQILLNARMSEKSYGSWRKARTSARQLLGAFGTIIAQSRADADRLAFLSGRTDVHVANLKLAAPPLPCDEETLGHMRDAVSGRPVWVAASTHPGEEVQMAKAHRAIRSRFPSALLVLVPRHPERGADVMAVLQENGLSGRLRSTIMSGALGQKVDPDDAVYIADTIGEMGVWYRLANIVFVGGSLVPHGGQNPMEPARLECAILHGPHMTNFPWMQDVLPLGQARVQVEDASAVAQNVIAFLEHPERAEQFSRAATAAAEQCAGGLNDAVKYIELALKKKGPQEHGGPS